MQVQIYSIRDAIAATFMRPFTMNSEKEAIRTFANAINDKNSECHHNPEDYSLYQNAIFDTETGEIIGHTSPKKIITGLQCAGLNQHIRSRTNETDLSNDTSIQPGTQG